MACQCKEKLRQELKDSGMTDQEIDHVEALRKAYMEGSKKLVQLSAQVQQLESLLKREKETRVTDFKKFEDWYHKFKKALSEAISVMPVASHDGFKKKYPEFFNLTVM